MSPLAALWIALDSLRAHALRSFLAMLGVIIGVAAVIVMAAIGEGAREMVDRQIRMLGANTLMITPGSAVVGGREAGIGTAVPFSDADVAAIRTQAPKTTRPSSRSFTSTTTSCSRRLFRNSSRLSISRSRRLP